MAQHPSSPLKFGSCGKIINGKQFLYSVIDFDIEQETRIHFPRIGHLILNIFYDERFKFRFLNCKGASSKHQHVYITGLFSDDPVHFQLQGQGRGFSMKVHPVVAHHVFKEDMSQFVNSQFSVRDIIGKGGSLLKMMEEDQQVKISENNHLEYLMLKNFPQSATIYNDPIYHAVNTIIQKQGKIKVSELAAAFSMSERTLNRQFLQKVGITPKAYAKIWQWQFVSELMMCGSYANLEELAFKAGYFDSAHLVRDFKDNARQTPFQFLKDLHPLVKDYLEFPETFC